MLIHRAKVVVRVVPRAVGADRMPMVMPVAVVPIYIRCDAVVGMPPAGPVVPIVRRVPTYPVGTPEPIIDVGAIDIDGLDDVVGAIDVLVTDDLHCNALCLRVFLYIDRSNILIDVLCQHGLDDHEVACVVGSLDDTEVVHLSVAVEVEVGEGRVGVVEHLFELFEVFGLPEQRSHRLQVEVLRYIRGSGSDRDGLVGASPKGGEQKPDRKKEHSGFHTHTSFKL